MSVTYPVYECYNSFQGEGIHMGRSAFLIRLDGCPIHCSWCDSAGTWHADHRPAEVQRMGAEALADMAAQKPSDFVIVTGGEPTIHNLEWLTSALHRQEKLIHLETSGACPIRGKFDWITMSPKRALMPYSNSIHEAHEIKLVIEKPDDFLFFHNYLSEKGVNHTPVWLHPEWGQRGNPEILGLIVRAVLDLPNFNYRAGWQIHRMYNADALDPRSKAPVPLGGDPARGF